MADGNGVTIIKKKKVSGGHGHHGGAWKVAYADFVTAMMAFFLLMWLLNATTEKQRQGIADYFSPTIPIHATSGGGDGPFTGSSVFATEVLPQEGRGATEKSPADEQQAVGEAGTSRSDEQNDDTMPSEQLGSVETVEESDFEVLEGMLLASSGESDAENLLLQHIRTRVTDEGLVIELFDLPDQPLFEPQSDTPTQRLISILAIITRVMSTITNNVAISGHSFLAVEGGPEIDWHLSSNRAHQARLELVANGLDAGRIARVTGLANRVSIFEPVSDPRNNRIEVTLLR